MRLSTLTTSFLCCYESKLISECERYFLYCIIIEIYPYIALFSGFPCEEIGSPLPIFELQIQENNDSGRHFMSRKKWQIILNILLLLYFSLEGFPSNMLTERGFCRGNWKALIVWHQSPSWAGADAEILRERLCSRMPRAVFPPRNESRLN